MLSQTFQLLLWPLAVFLFIAHIHGDLLLSPLFMFSLKDRPLGALNQVPLVGASLVGIVHSW